VFWETDSYLQGSIAATLSKSPAGAAASNGGLSGCRFNSGHVNSTFTTSSKEILMSELISISAELVTPQAFAIDTQLISDQVAKYSSLTIAGIDDKAGAKAVKEARLELKKVRTTIENKRKELKEGSLQFGRKVDAVAKELTSLVEPTEKLLESREREIENKIAEIAAERLRNRVEQLNNVRAILPPIKTLETLSDDAFAVMLKNATEEHATKMEREAEQARQEKLRREQEEAERKAEAERLRAEREALEAEREKQRQEQARIDEQRRIEQEEFRRRQEEAREALEAERREMKREIRRLQEEQEEERRKVQEEREAIEAAKAEQARKEREAIEAKERAEQAERDHLEAIDQERLRAERLAEEKRIAEETAKRDAEERERIAQLMKPVREKFAEYIMSIESLPVPNCGEPGAIGQGGLAFNHELEWQVRDAVTDCVNRLRAIVETHCG